MPLAKLLRGEPIAQLLRAETIASAAILRERGGVEPTLATVLVGQQPSALAYQQAIARAAGEVGISHRSQRLPAATSPDGMVALIQRLNDDRTVNGVVVLMPLPDHLPPSLVLEHLSPLKDVDGITPTNAGRLHLGLP